MTEPNSTAGELLQTHGKTQNISPELAEANGNEVAMQMATIWGRQQLYMPKDIHVQASKLHQQIFDEWSGRNYRVIAMNHNLLLAFVYKVIKSMLLAVVAREQGDLFASYDEE